MVFLHICILTNYFFSGDLRCTFDDRSLCRWLQVRENWIYFGVNLVDDFDWVIDSGQAGIAETGPDQDHTSGRGRVRFYLHLQNLAVYVTSNIHLQCFLYRQLYLLTILHSKCWSTSLVHHWFGLQQTSMYGILVPHEWQADGNHETTSALLGWKRSNDHPVGTFR